MLKLPQKLQGVRRTRRVPRSLTAHMAISMVLLAATAGTAIYLIGHRRAAMMRIDPFNPTAEQVSAVTSRASRGDVDAQLDLAQAYGAGWGVERDDKAMSEWLRKAADQGNAVAQYRLGQALLEGAGIARDPAAAAGWFKKAAEGGQVDAQFAYGAMLIEGMGVKADPVEGFAWINMLSDAGYKPAWTVCSQAVTRLSREDFSRMERRRQELWDKHWGR